MSPDQGVIYFVGVGGIGMSGLAKFLKAEGYRVAGSDLALSEKVKSLREIGIPVDVPQKAENLPPGTSRLVCSAAIPENHPERQEAVKRGIPVQFYAQLLGEVMAGKYGLAIAGTHGKTTTSSLTAWVLRHAGLDPSFVVGGDVPCLGGSSAVGSGPYFVAEACEYRRSFHHLHPKIAVITNIEEDHLDYYRDLADIVDSFQQFARQIEPDGALVIRNDLESRFTEAVARGRKVVTFGMGQEAQIVAHHCRWSKSGWKFALRRHNKELGTFRLPLAGSHNILNALAAAAVALELDVEPGRIGLALESFGGVHRRLERIPNPRGFPILDDYAHHPTEIAAGLRTLRQVYKKHRLVCIFQPHQHSRTRFLLKDFVTALCLADEVMLPDIYFVRDSEEEKSRVSSQDMVVRILNEGVKARFMSSFDEIVETVRREIEPNWVVVTMGAGDIGRVAARIAQELPQGKQ